jgi:acetyl-CoA C-acetyltransferase
MPADPRSPVLVGVGAVQQREEDPERALETLELMAQALERAAEDAGSRALLARADSIRAPRGFWTYSDPCRLLAQRFGAARARTEVAEVGVLQTTLLGRAARDIAEGRADVVLLTGGEARHRAARAQALGREAPLTAQQGVEPDSVLRPAAEIVTGSEIRSQLARPVNQYALIENALRVAEGQKLDDHLRDVAELWAGFSRVAAANPDAWSREVFSADEIGRPGPGNRMLAFPYTRRLVSQWNVDQAAGLVLCSLETARSLGLPEPRRVFPLAVVDSGHMLPLTRRRELHRSPGFALAGRRALARTRRELDGVAHLELYSCFPSAVRVQQRELGVPAERQVTVTGGMTFAGGPLNNFVLQAWVRMAQVLRGDPGSTGLVTAISGIITKQGVSLLSTEAGEGFVFEDVSAETAARCPEVEVLDDEARGAARVASYTVLYDGERPARVVLLCDLEDGRRALSVAEDPDLAEQATRDELCGRPLELPPRPPTAPLSSRGASRRSGAGRR